MKWLAPIALLLAAACGDPQSGTPQPEPEQFQADTRGCDDVVEVCLETAPPQCYEVCNDPAPGPAACEEEAGDLVQCGDETCVEGENEAGELVRVCAGPDCVVSYDVATGVETISCPTG